jgi:Zn-dependent protease with chaperone function
VWCERCEWNLQAPDTEPGKRAGWLAKRSHRLAFAINAATFEELVKQPIAPRRWTRSGLLLTAVASILFAGMLLLVGYGLDLLLNRGFGFKLIGVLFVLVGIQLRPRVGRLDRSLGLASRDQVPELFAIVDEAAAELGAPRIELLVLDDSYNSWCGRFGLRQRPVLCLGLGLWGTLSGQARIALLAHELGHLVNRDPARGLLSGQAVNTFYRLADLLNPRGLFSGVRAKYWLPERLGQIGSQLLLTPIYLLVLWIGYLMAVAAARDHRRAEFYAHALAISVGGTAAMAELLGCALFGSSVRTAVRRTNSSDPREWHSAASRVLGERSAQLARAEQYSLRAEASLLGSHPPAGLRLRVARRWPDLPGRLVISGERFAVADAELEAGYRRVARALQLTN